jgi:hypothetical protein
MMPSTVTALRLLCVALLGVGVSAQTPDTTQKPATPPDGEFKDLSALMASLPKAAVKPLDAASAMLFTALPLACVDDLQPRPAAATRPYFWQPTYRTVEGYERTRAFYGCSDWATSVGATWTLVTLLKQYPALPSGELIREKLTAHLGRDNLDGELTYFRSAPNSQRPYGHAWFLRLYADLATWKDSDGLRYAENAAPLARFLADGLVTYLASLERPNRGPSNVNSALALNVMLDYAEITRDLTIRRVVGDAARRFYLTDTACATNTEAAAPEMVSPCLEEAALMSRVLDAAGFAPWFDKFLPAAYAAAFKPLRSINFDATGGRGRGGRGEAAGAAPPAAGAAPPAPGGAGRGGGQANPRANWIGLAFTRAAAFARLATVLPAADPRVPVFRRLADLHAQLGQQELVTSAAFDAPWVGALAVSYLSPKEGAK